jgi:peroxiredoxin
LITNTTRDTDIRLAGLLTNTNESVIELSENGPVLLVFLRHFGCIFCREALRDLALKRNEYESKGITIIFVHMADKSTAEMYFRSFNLDGIRHISDPQCSYYSAFELGKATIGQLFGFKNLVRGFEVTVSKGIPVMSSQIGDGNQMPGVFVIHRGKIIREFRHSFAGDKPDYDSIVNIH